MFYAVTADATKRSEEIWPQFEAESDRISDVEGDQYDLGSTWQVWAATTDRAAAMAFKSVVEQVLGQGYVAIEEVHIYGIRHNATSVLHKHPIIKAEYASKEDAILTLVDNRFGDSGYWYNDYKSLADLISSRKNLCFDEQENVEIIEDLTDDMVIDWLAKEQGASSREELVSSKRFIEAGNNGIGTYLLCYQDDPDWDEVLSKLNGDLEFYELGE